MDEGNFLIICRACGRKILMHNMRLDDDKENMICNDCYARKTGVKSSKSVLGTSKHLENTPFNSPEEKRAKTVKSDKLVKYICTSCKYKFSRKSDQHVAKCPYCGKTTIVIDNALGAEKLLGESTDKRFDW